MAKVFRNHYSCFSLAHQSVYHPLKDIKQTTAEFSALEKETLMQKYKLKGKFQQVTHPPPQTTHKVFLPLQLQKQTGAIIQCPHTTSLLEI